jgi:hypothetical protein
MWFWR